MLVTTLLATITLTPAARAATSNTESVGSSQLAQAAELTPDFTAQALSGNSYVEGTDPAAAIFDPLVVNRVDITLPQASRDALQQDGKGAYQPAQMVFTTAAGASAKMDVGLRLKGGIGSYRNLDQKAGFKVKMNFSVKGQKLFGIKKFTFNNMVQDATMLHEAVTYRLFRAMGVPAPRVGYVRVIVNGIDYGLHSNIETYDSVSLKRWFSSTQHLYEGAYWTQDIIDSQYQSLQIDEGDLNNRDDLAALASVNNLTDKAWFDAVQKYLDLNEFVKEMAVERYTGHWDGYAWTIKNNYYAHSDKNGVFSILPWGTDQTLNGWFDAYSYADVGTMAQRCLSYSPCLQLYKGALLKVRDVAESLSMPVMVDDVWQSIKTYVESDPRKEQGYDAAIWGVDGAKNALNSTSGLVAPVVNQSNAAGTVPLNHSSYLRFSYPSTTITVGTKLSPTIIKDGGAGGVSYQVVRGTENCSVGFSSGLVTVRAIGYCRISAKAAVSGEWAASINYVDLMSSNVAGSVNISPIASATYGELNEVVVEAQSTGVSTIDVSGPCELVDAVFVRALSGTGTCTITVNVAGDANYLASSASIDVPLAKAKAAAKKLTSSKLYTGKLPQNGYVPLNQTPSKIIGSCVRSGLKLIARAKVGSCIVSFAASESSNFSHPAVTHTVLLVPATQSFVGSFASIGSKQIGATKLVLASQPTQVTNLGASASWSASSGCNLLKESNRVSVKLRGRSSCTVTLKSESAFGLPTISKKWVLTY